VCMWGTIIAKKKDRRGRKDAKPINPKMTESCEMRCLAGFESLSRVYLHNSPDGVEDLAPN